jgi:hypothetical protein
LRLRLVGAGRLGTAVANAAVRAGVGRIFLADNDPVDPTIHRRPGLATTQAQALAAALSDTIHSDGLWPRANTPGSTMPRNAQSSDPDECGRDAAETVRVVDHWSKPERTPLDLTVIATDYAEPDPAIGRDFVDGQHPHLYLRPSQGGAVVGPFVRPAATPCLRCIDLTRRDADPAWATMLPQLCRTRMPVTPLLAAWAAVTAITQIVAVWTGQLPSTLSGTVELTPQQAEPRFRRWPAHPQCGCGRSERW